MLARPVSPLVERALTLIGCGLRERFGARLLDLRLFGSYARGEANESSDLDVFVLLDEASWADYRAALDLAGDLSRELELTVSPVVMGRAQFEEGRAQRLPLAVSVAREGIRL